MKDLLLLLYGEIIKVKKIKIIWLLIGLIAADAIYNSHRIMKIVSKHPDRWDITSEFFRIMIEENVISVLYIILTVAFIVSLVSRMEIISGSKNRLFILPIQRWKIFAAKILLSHTILVVFIVTSALTFYLSLSLFAGRNALEAVNFMYPLQNYLKFYHAFWFFISIHTWIMLRFESFTVSLGVTMVGFIFAIILHNDSWGTYCPWLFMLDGQEVNASLGLQFRIAGGIVMGILGGWDVIRRDVFS